jgi:thiol-disulfide isomerase/thioredoxin
MEIIPMGSTSLPEDVIAEYLESLKEIYTAEACRVLRVLYRDSNLTREQSYDLFMHNCNNFSNDFAMFLVGKGIPEHITSLPQTVLDTPFGQMLRPQLDSAMRSMTQAPLPPQSSLPQRSNGGSSNGQPVAAHPKPVATVHNITSLRELEPLLESAQNSCAVIFFTSSTCPPCKLVYPAYDELAAEAGDKAVLIKVDIGKAYDVASRYSIRATPTFITYLKGEKENMWSGASEGQLRGNVELLLQMAHPQHPHTNMRFNLPTLLGTSQAPVKFDKVPPLSKVIAKMGEASKDPIIPSIQSFITLRSESGAREAPLPDLPAFASFLQQAPKQMQVDVLFTAVDLFRLTLVDPRVSGFFAEEASQQTVTTLLSHVNTNLSITSCPYSLRLTLLQATCNLFSSRLYAERTLTSPALINPVITLVTTSLLDDTNTAIRVAAASVAFNIAAVNRQQRTKDEQPHEALAEAEQVELVASLVEAIGQEESSAEALKGLLLALGLLLHCAPVDGEVVDVCRAMGAREVVLGKKKAFPKEKLVAEVGNVLLKGF